MSRSVRLKSILATAATAMLLGCQIAIAQTTLQEYRELLKEGKGDWCYAPVGRLTETIRSEYIEYAVARAAEAQRKYGIPGAMLAAMSIRESGYGTTRLALLANNVLSFKRPSNVNWQFGRPEFILWCQPVKDKGNAYIRFGSKDAAFDYVAKVLAERPDLSYQSATNRFKAAIRSGQSWQKAAMIWLNEIAKDYVEDPEYITAVTEIAARPMQITSSSTSSRSLWERIPPER